jgi:spore maturation protein CgeB
MYTGSLNFFYKDKSGLDGLSYNEQLNSLITSTTEFVGSYNKTFIRLGIDAHCIIANDKLLQNKWCTEHGIENRGSGKTLFEQVRYYKPEVLWIENLGLINEEWLNSVNKQIKSIRLIIGYHCSPLNAKIENSLKGVDLIITCTPGLKSLFESNGKLSFLIYHGFDTDILSNPDSGKLKDQTDLVFSGSLTTGGGFHQDRIRLIEQILENHISLDLYANLESHLRIKAKQSLYLVNKFLANIGMSKIANNFRILEYGKTKVENYSNTLLSKTKPPVFGMDMYNLFLQSKIVLNFHIGVAGNYAGNMRLFEVTGVGSCLLTDNKKNMNDLFSTEDEVVVYDNPNDCIAKIKWLLEHEDERKNIALKGQKRTLRYHTITDRCNSVIDIIYQELKKV